MSVTSEEEEDHTLLSDARSNVSTTPDYSDDDRDEDNEDDEEEDGSSGTDDDGSEDDDDDDDDSDGSEPLLPPPPLAAHAFAPPFYGRPPTPLPPSPSLTSLLRPSRPTTPDASDDELEPVPRASPKVPTYEYYGFVLYLFSSLSFLIYLLWSYLPSPFLHALGIYYYPNRWWSLAIPSFLVAGLVYIYVALAAYNIEVLTLPLDSIETVVDDAAKIAVVDSRGRILQGRARRVLEGKESREAGRGATGGARLDKGHERDAGKNNKKKKKKAGQERDANSGRRKREKEGARGGSGAGWETTGDGPGFTNGPLNWREVWNEGTDAVMDVPLAGVCEILYGEEGEENGDVDIY